MKTLAVILFSVFSLTSCNNDDETTFTATPELQPYVTSFFTEASLRGKNLPQLNLIAQIDQIQSVSEISKDGDQWVLKVDKEMFESMSGNPDNKIEAFMFHELGRIILGRELSKDNSIMNGNIKVSGYSNAQRSGLLDELFQ